MLCRPPQAGWIRTCYTGKDGKKQTLLKSGKTYKGCRPLRKHWKAFIYSFYKTRFINILVCFFWALGIHRWAEAKISAFMALSSSGRDHTEKKKFVSEIQCTLEAGWCKSDRKGTQEKSRLAGRFGGKFKEWLQRALVSGDVGKGPGRGEDVRHTDTQGRETMQRGVCPAGPKEVRRPGWPSAGQKQGKKGAGVRGQILEGLVSRPMQGLGLLLWRGLAGSEDRIWLNF